MGEVTLECADAVEILSLVDNSVDYLSSLDRSEVSGYRTWIKQRKPGESRLPLAEHGFSMLIRVFKGKRTRTILFDTAASSEALLFNADVLGVRLGDVEAVVLSHGHWDHTGGLVAAVKAIDKPNLPVVVHEHMFRTRGMALADGTVRKHRAFPSAEQVQPAMYVVTQKPSLLLDNLVLVTGEIPHLTDFEKGLPESRCLSKGEWVPEPWLLDDRAVAVNVKGKGLVVLSGCGHAGIINTVNYTRQLTSIKNVCAVWGGFHLAGKQHEKTIPQTARALKQLKPSLVAPSHCTGWRGLFAIHETLPEAFVWNSVGNLYRFE